jgi:proteasome accessory factor B
MAISKVERLMNLVIALLSTSGYLTADRIRANVAGYADSPSDEAFARMFERDKNELRDLGIPLETGRVSRLDPTEGCRINRDVYALPGIELSPDEAAAVAVATQLWESPELITATQSALLKLRAAGVDVDPDDGVAITSAVERYRDFVVGHRFWAGRAVQASAVAGRPAHLADGRAVGSGDGPRTVVSGRA